MNSNDNQCKYTGCTDQGYYYRYLSGDKSRLYCYKHHMQIGDINVTHTKSNQSQVPDTN